MQFLCELGDIPDYGSKGFSLQGLNLFAVRQKERVHVYHNSCPHMGIPLEWVEDRFLDLDGELIQCSTHGALFTIHDGLCVAGPCSGRSLTAIPAELRQQQVWVDASAL
ncbi:Rieske (2Fe-2S) protein [Pseudomaricurvus sp. HS19]|uniref:Rieske (2Fe-2S) protein n=1 Tax=Pseudomaricurvus sp. HS19 TaxID=2692626 RepID=UPI00136D870B|nr:Rieske 2Fe-2S domain-containing protein [Pseudomaricurvus sp. HS19]